MSSFPSTSTAAACCSQGEVFSDFSDFTDPATAALIQSLLAENDAIRAQEARDEALARSLNGGMDEGDCTIVGGTGGSLDLAALACHFDDEEIAADAAYAAQLARGYADAAAAKEAQAQADLEAAQQVQEAEAQRMEDKRRRAQERAEKDAALTALLAHVSEHTQQDIALLDRDAVLRDWDQESKQLCGDFQCCIFFDDMSKAGDGVCIGNWNGSACNHWISKDALREHLKTCVTDFSCPACRADPCPRCARHPPAQTGMAPCCGVPPKQVRELLTPAEVADMERAQRLHWLNTNAQHVVQCPDNDCDFYYCVDPEDQAGGENSADSSDGDRARRAKWRQGQDMWCQKCQQQYCLYCCDTLGTSVRYHKGRTCAEYQQALKDQEAHNRRMRQEAEAQAGHEKHRGQTWQRCPKCRFECWKLECNRVMCKCRAQFCFLCGTDITGTSYDHFNKVGSCCYGKVWHNNPVK